MTLQDNDGISKDKGFPHVMNLLGDKNVENTLIYAHLVASNQTNYISKAA